VQLALLLIILAIVQLATIGAASAFVLSHRSAFTQILAARTAELERALNRIAFLENTIDEVRARDLGTAPPIAIDPTPEKAPLPEAIREQLELIEDPDGEIEALARYRLEVEKVDEDAVARELFG
jgi:hypothetical protein